MNLCLTYMWKCWRRKSTVVGLVLFSMLCLVGVHLNGPLGKHPQHQENLEEVFKSTQKRLQSDVDRPGVRFLPRKTYTKGLPIQNSPQNLFNGIQNFEGSVNKKNPLLKEDKSRLTGFKEINGLGLQPYGVDNTEYDTVAKNVQPQFFPSVYIPAMNSQANSQFRYPNSYSARSDQVLHEPPKEPHFYVPEQRIIHFDLKGAPPRLDYIIKILKWVKEAGATGVLLEYEDMFPFTGELSKVAATNHYNQSDIEIIVNKCQDLGLELIPLIQTFGHMEFILKHEEYAELRDTPEMPESICPCHQGTFPLIMEYIDQVLAFHKSSRYLHIGCDEVYHLGGCMTCQGLPRSRLFVSYVAKVAKYVKEKYHKTVIIWDDMLRGFVTNEMQPLADLVEPMVWVYAEEPYRFMPSYNWARLAEVFPTAWTSSAFKGADGPTSSVPNIQKRLQNNLKWLELMSIEEEKFREGFRGIAITGWQRYDHFAVLAELLPVGIPSLGVNLLAVTHGFFNESLKSELFQRLGCIEGSIAFDSFVNLTIDPYLWDKMGWCFFPGAEIFKLTRNLENVQEEVSNYLNKVQVEQGWLTGYSMRRNYSSPMRIDEGLEEMPRIQFSVTNLIRHAHNSLSEVYDDFTVAEWIEQKIYPMYVELAKLKKDATELKKRHDWPKRPLPILPELRAFGVGVPTTLQPSNSPSGHKDDISPVVSALQGPPNPGSIITVRPKRLVQAPDLYRHPPVSNN